MRLIKFSIQRNLLYIYIIVLCSQSISSHHITGSASKKAEAALVAVNKKSAEAEAETKSKLKAKLRGKPLIQPLDVPLRSAIATTTSSDEDFANTLAKLGLPVEQSDKYTFVAGGYILSAESDI